MTVSKRSIWIFAAALGFQLFLVGAFVLLEPGLDYRWQKTAEMACIGIAVLIGLIPIFLQRWPLRWRVVSALVYVPIMFYILFWFMLVFAFLVMIWPR